MNSVLHSKRASNVCPDSYTADNGLAFKTSCLQNFSGNDIAQQVVGTMQDCMALCSAAGGGIMCAGISFNTNDGTCYMKNRTVLSAMSSSSIVTHSAVVTKVDFNAPTACQFTNGTEQTTSNGMHFQILCSNNMPLNDFCPLNGPTPARRAGVCPYHADSLEDCMEKCSDSAPLCQAVVYNPDMTGAYANCYPKTALSRSGLAPSSQGPPFSHMAYAVDLPMLDQSCKNGSNMTAAGGAVFELSCNDNRAGNDLDRTHAEDWQSCIDACGKFNNATAGECAGALWDSTLGSGWENCWLKSASGTSSFVQGNHFALKVSGSTSGGSTETSSSSKAWIAGVIVGVIAVILLLAFAAWFMRRRRSKAGPQHVYEKSATSAPVVYEKSVDQACGPAGSAKPALPYELGDQTQPHGWRHGAPLEADGGQVHELPSAATPK